MYHGTAVAAACRRARGSLALARQQTHESVSADTLHRMPRSRTRTAEAQAAEAHRSLQRAIPLGSRNLHDRARTALPTRREFVPPSPTRRRSAVVTPATRTSKSRALGRAAWLGCSLRASQVTTAGCRATARRPFTTQRGPSEGRSTGRHSHPRLHRRPPTCTLCATPTITRKGCDSSRPSPALPPCYPSLRMASGTPAAACLSSTTARRSAPYCSLSTGGRICHLTCLSLTFSGTEETVGADTAVRSLFSHMYPRAVHAHTRSDIAYYVM